MVTQPKLGLCTHWRALPGRFDSNCPAAFGSALKAGIWPTITRIPSQTRGKMTPGYDGSNLPTSQAELWI